MLKYSSFETALVKQSTITDFKIAKMEWEIQSVVASDIFSKCICGHRIKNLVHIKNIQNQNTAIIGNCCVFYINKSLAKYVAKEIRSKRKLKKLKQIQTQEISDWFKKSCPVAIIKY
jgi:hypothetical protein